MKVAVIGGGVSSEHDVSVESAAAVTAGLLQAGCQVQEFTIDRSGSWFLADQPLGANQAQSLAAAVTELALCDVVFPVLHGPMGEDGTLAALCALLGVPFVGSPQAAAALAMDKWATKLVAAELGINTAGGKLLHRGEHPGEISSAVVVKPVVAGSSFGVSLVRPGDDLDAALQLAFEQDDRVLLEEVMVGREIDIAVVERPDGSLLCSPPLEIHTKGVFTTSDKYEGDPDFSIPAPLSDAQHAELTALAKAMFTALGCRDIARVDCFLTDAGWVLNEVNTMPGMTSHSQVPKMFAAAGVTYPTLLNQLVESAAGVTKG